jgi:uncharacterized protein YkwD
VLHASDTARYGYFYTHPHQGSDGSTPIQRVIRAGLRAHAVGEMTAFAQSVRMEVVQLTRSPLHRRIMLGRYRWIGAGIARWQSGWLLTVDLVR